jgi:hypothetical protein
MQSAFLINVIVQVRFGVLYVWNYWDKNYCFVLSNSTEKADPTSN